MPFPTRAAVANDLGERCQLILGNFGYNLTNGKPFIVKPQRSQSPSAVFVGSPDFLTMRDYDYWSRIFVDDWRKGAGQIRITVDDPVSKARYFDSTSIDITQQSQLTMLKDITANTNGTSANGGIDSLPLLSVGGFLYMGESAAFKFSADWTAAPSTASSGFTGDIKCLATDGQSVFGGSAGQGIVYANVGGTTTAILNSTSTNPRSLLFANRRLYALGFTGAPAVSVFYEAALYGGAGTTNFNPPTSWTLTDLAARTGGAVDSPIYILGNDSGSRSALWYWDGVTIHDYVALPVGFLGYRLKYYQGILFILGVELNPTGTYSPVVYHIANDTLGKIGYLGIPQSNGDPTPGASATRSGFWIDTTGNLVYFTAPFTSLTIQEIWRYDIVNGGLSRHASIALGSTIDSMALHKSAPWLTFNSVGLYSSRSTFISSAQLVASDLHLGQPWANNLWTIIELVSSVLRAGEVIQVEYSTNQGSTWTSAGTMSFGTDGAITRKPFTISTASASVLSSYLRLRFTFTAGTSQLTSPALYSYALKATPIDPSGPLIDCWVTCPDISAMPGGGPDWQGASGAERIQNIIDLFEAQAVVNCIYMKSGTTRAKNPTTIPVKVIDYEQQSPSSIGYGPNRGVEGDMHLILRQVI